uniref:Uncharacterized protein n=1 Tax=Callithrix jacchus TaxID=9483 RepID=A0A5F4W8X2_CALJA
NVPDVILGPGNTTVKKTDQAPALTGHPGGQAGAVPEVRVLDTCRVCSAPCTDPPFWDLSNLFLCPGTQGRIPDLLSLTLLPSLEYNGRILAHCNLCLSGSSNPPASASRIAGIIGVHYHTQVIFVFLVELVFHHVSQAGLEHLNSHDLPASAS